MKNFIKKEINFDGKKIEYFLRKSEKAKRIKIEIKKNGEIFLVVPKLIPNFLGIIFLKSRMGWVLDKIEFFEKGGGEAATQKIPTLSKKDFLKYKKDAEILIKERVLFFAKQGNFSYGKITIKNNKTNWGSCSSKGNLNFNYRLIFLKKEEMDYVVVHELCHLKEMNHSKKFWDEVEKIIPDYKELRKNIKNLY